VMDSIQMSKALRETLLPVIVFLGTIFNLISFFVMRRMQSSTSYYLSILGLIDTG
jgi:hypothetical protein